jgi:predicted nucleic acid-binding protein
VILADTSAWVEYDRATGSDADLRMTELIERDGPLCVTEPVAMEVLAGARSDQQRDELTRLLRHFAWLPFHAETDFTAAADIYRACRRGGVTPRGLLDCLIAQVALRNGVALLACDADLARVAGVVGLRLDGS